MDVSAHDGVALDTGRRGGGRKHSDMQILRAMQLEQVPAAMAESVARQTRTRLVQLGQRATRGKSHAAVKNVLNAPVGEQDSPEKALIRAFGLRKMRLLESDIETAQRRLMDLRRRGRCPPHQDPAQDVWIIAAAALTVHEQWQPSGDYAAWHTEPFNADALLRCANDFCADKKIPHPTLCAKAISHIWKETASPRLAAEIPWLVVI